MSASSNPAQGTHPRRRLLDNPPHWTTVLAVVVLVAVLLVDHGQVGRSEFIAGLGRVGLCGHFGFGRVGGVGHGVQS